MFSKLFSENSEVSMMRVMSMLSLSAGIVIGAYGLCTNKDMSALSMLCGVFVGAAFGGKVGQKFAERE